MSILDILKQYTTPGAAQGDVHSHFDTVAQQASPGELSSGIAAAMRSNATPSFGDTIGGLFGNSNPDQRAGILNQLVKSIGPGALASVGGGVLGKILGSGGAQAPISPAQAAQVSPSDVSAIAAHAEQHDGSIIDRVSGFYAQHPTLIKTLGAAALAATMSHMGRQQTA
jgi:hypothetical protein